ncbi:unnamed protein product [Schistosoma curassoni]|uniref:Ovule protein n=1 Tax=Schistosoma curassoni TaxID=6186 RepID=A0A183KX73_9TREM|nr:unnamed protein product [Schistosoma curassoni]
MKNIWNSKTTVGQPTPRSMEMSRQFYCMWQKLGELRNSSSRGYKCLSTVVYTKYFEIRCPDRHYQQQPTIGENKPDPREGRNQEVSLDVDRTHIDESTQLRHKTSSHMKSSRPKEERKNKEHITSGNRSNWKELERITHDRVG